MCNIYWRAVRSKTTGRLENRRRILTLFKASDWLASLLLSYSGRAARRLHVCMRICVCCVYVLVYIYTFMGRASVWRYTLSLAMLSMYIESDNNNICIPSCIYYQIIMRHGGPGKNSR